VRIWRITAHKHIETVFSGVGGLYVSGRWHPQGYKISYTSESLALASLEVFVHSESIDITDRTGARASIRSSNVEA
jgi:RES domain-containing protein